MLEMDLWHVMETLHPRDGCCMSMETRTHECTFKLPGPLITVYYHGCRSKEIPPRALKSLPCSDPSWRQQGGGTSRCCRALDCWGAAPQYLSGKGETVVLRRTAPGHAQGSTAKHTSGFCRGVLVGLSSLWLSICQNCKIFTVA